MTTPSRGREAAQFYAAESAKVLQGYFHAAALTGKTLEDVLRWVANPTAATEPSEILRRHPHAEAFGTGCCTGRSTATAAPPGTPLPLSSRP